MTDLALCATVHCGGIVQKDVACASESETRLRATAAAAQLDVKIAEPLSFRVTQIFQYDAATVRSREPYDIRATLGFVWTKK